MRFSEFNLLSASAISFFAALPRSIMFSEVSMAIATSNLLLDEVDDDDEADVVGQFDGIPSALMGSSLNFAASMV